MPPASAAPYPRSATSTTRAPACSATAREPSREPLSATSTSPVISARARKPRALATQLPTVAASLRQGKRIVNSVIRRPGAPKKKVPRRVPFHQRYALLLAAAGAGQILQRDRSAGAPALPSPQRRAVALGDRRRRRGSRPRNQRNERTIHRSRDASHRGCHAAVRVGSDSRHVLRGLRGANFAAPVAWARKIRRAGLVHFRDRGAARAHAENHFRHLRAHGVVLIRRQRDRRQNANDRNHDHQLDQGEALLQRLHGYSLVLLVSGPLCNATCPVHATCMPAPTVL